MQNPESYNPTISATIISKSFDKYANFLSLNELIILRFFIHQVHQNCWRYNEY